MAEAGGKKFIYWADLIRVVAIYLVVMVHVSGQLLNAWGQVSLAQWLLADVYGALARVSVPLFFMISGYLLLPRSEDLRTFYSKRMTRLLIPFLVWSLIYLAWYCGGHPNTCSPDLIQRLLFVQGTYYHLWFLYSLVSIYLALPLLRLMIQPEPNRKILWYLIGLWLVFQPGATLLRAIWKFQINISAPLATGFVCYFFLGYLLGELELTRRRIRLAALVLVISVGVTVLGTYLLTARDGEYNGFFYDFASYNVFLASAAIFLLLRQISGAGFLSSDRMHSASRILAEATFGIYLVHVLVIEILFYAIPSVPVNSFMGSALWSIPFVCTLVFGLSFLIVHGLQQIPLVRRIVS